MTPTGQNTASGKRVGQLDWSGISEDLNQRGYATTGPLLMPAECADLIKSYPREALFRKKVVMQRHSFGQGEYQYFSYPLPPLVQDLRTCLYPHLARIANSWQERSKADGRFPNDHADYLHTCAAAGQNRPTPLMLRYQQEDYNRLHQDLYGDLVFPLQVTLLLSDPDSDFTGGEFVVTEQRVRQQSSVEVVPLSKGEGVIFAVNKRPVAGTRTYQVRMRHGVSRLRSGDRYALGIIFHDAA